jgi:hypothetical protein
MVLCMLLLRLELLQTNRKFLFSVIFVTDIWKQSLKFKLAWITVKKWLLLLGKIDRYIFTKRNKLILSCIDICKCVSKLNRMMNIDDIVIFNVYTPSRCPWLHEGEVNLKGNSYMIQDSCLYTTLQPRLKFWLYIHNRFSVRASREDIFIMDDLITTFEKCYKQLPVTGILWISQCTLPANFNEEAKSHLKLPILSSQLAWTGVSK